MIDVILLQICAAVVVNVDTSARFMAKNLVPLDFGMPTFSDFDASKPIFEDFVVCENSLPVVVDEDAMLGVC